MCDSDFQIANKRIEKQLEKLEKERIQLEQQADVYAESQQRLFHIKEVLQNGIILKKARQYTILYMVEKLIVYPQNQIEVMFKENILLFEEQVAKSECKDLLYKPITKKDSKVQNRSIIVEYIHKDNIYKRRMQTNQQLLQFFRENPNITLKETAMQLERTSSYINTSIKQLKQQGKLQYKRYGNDRGEWIVLE